MANPQSITDAAASGRPLIVSGAQLKEVAQWCTDPQYAATLRRHYDNGRTVTLTPQFVSMLCPKTTPTVPDETGTSVSITVPADE